MAETQYPRNKTNFYLRKPTDKRTGNVDSRDLWPTWLLLLDSNTDHCVWWVLREAHVCCGRWWWRWGGGLRAPCSTSCPWFCKRVATTPSFSRYHRNWSWRFLLNIPSKAEREITGLSGVNSISHLFFSLAMPSSCYFLFLQSLVLMLMNVRRSTPCKIYST